MLKLLRFPQPVLIFSFSSRKKRIFDKLETFESQTKKSNFVVLIYLIKEKNNDTLTVAEIKCM